MSKQSQQELKNELNTNRQLEGEIFDKIWKDLYKMSCKAGFKHVEIGDKFIKATDEHGRFKIELNVKVSMI